MSGFGGKVAIVTGGGSGLGEAIGKALAAKGATVVLSDIRREGAERVAAEIAKAGGTASAFLQDTAKPEDCEAVVRYAVQSYGALHYAVNNAGIGGAQAPAGETDLADWDRVIAINLSGVLYGMRYQIPAMLKAGARESAIVNMASIHGTVAAIGNGAYTAAKHGIVGSPRTPPPNTGRRGCASIASGQPTSRLPCSPASRRSSGRSWSRGTRSAGSAGRTRSRRSSASCSPTRRRS